MSAGFFWISVSTFAILLIVYNLTDVPRPDINSVATSNISVTNTSGRRVAPTLQLVVVLSRHGSRGPAFTYPASPYQAHDTKYWPNGWMELTAMGHVQMYKLGVKIRSLYDGFLDEIYHTKDFRANSTLFERSMMSAGEFLAGLFPPRVMATHQAWQPVPIYPVYFDHQELMYIKGKNLCRRFKQAQKDSLLKVDKLYNSSMTSFIDYILPYTGINLNDILKMFGSLHRLQIVILVWESLQNLVENGVPLPDWATKIYPEPLTSLFVKIFGASAAGTNDQIRYLEGEFIQELAGLIQSKANNALNPNRRMFYYSVHDYTLLILLRLLGQQEIYVNIGSALIYELHRHPLSGHFYIQVLYIDGGSPDLEPKEVNITGCDFPCDFHLLLNISEKYSITDWDKECRIGWMS